MENKLLMADQILKSYSSDAGSGFNRRVLGDSQNEACGYPNPPYAYAALYAGWSKAEEMINAGKIYYTHIFSHRWGEDRCKGKAFSYGGTFVCNTCGKRDLDQPWWNIKVSKDGDAWHVMGEGFVNLQESENYAFGATKEEALQNYQTLMEDQPMNNPAPPDELAEAIAEKMAYNANREDHKIAARQGENGKKI